MCGIVGYIGFRNGVDECIKGLERLEYRGYDSSGVAAIDLRGQLEVNRSLGGVAKLSEKVARAQALGRTAIGHTRWATHGEPSEHNAHPHVDCTGELAVVHNGIIENHAALRAELKLQGHEFYSDTDTEVIAHLVEGCFEGDLLDAVRQAAARLRGSFAFAVVRASGDSSEIVTTRCGSPLIVGLGDDEAFLASDVVAVLDRTRQILFLEDGDFAVLKRNSVEFFDAQGRRISRPVTRVEWTPEAAERGGHEHFMRKEIGEQAATLERICAGRVTRDPSGRRRVAVDEVGALLDASRSPRRVAVAACGTSYHAGLMTKGYLERLARIPTDVFIASEFRYEEPLLDQTEVFLSVSQSGETADTLASLELARDHGLRSLAICNVVGSRLCREADATVLTQAGPEIGVASTKAFSSQVIAGLLIALDLAARNGSMTPQRIDAVLRELESLPQKVAAVIASEAQIADVAHAHAHARSFLFLGRGLQVPVALEGALKLKEITYTPAEGGAAGEIKHGPIALIDPGVTTVFLATPSPTHDKLMANISTIAARNGPIVAVCVGETPELSELADDLLLVPQSCPELQPVINTVALQLFSYHVARTLEREIDKPRNLAKSVTVE